VAHPDVVHVLHVGEPVVSKYIPDLQVVHEFEEHTAQLVSTHYVHVLTKLLPVPVVDDE